jgi:hypothetical protein
MEALNLSQSNANSEKEKKICQTNLRELWKLDRFLKKIKYSIFLKENWNIL